MMSCAFLRGARRGMGECGDEGEAEADLAVSLKTKGSMICGISLFWPALGLMRRENVPVSWPFFGPVG